MNHLRTHSDLYPEQGTVLGKIEFAGEPVDIFNPNLKNLVADVSTKVIDNKPFYSKNVFLLFNV